MKPVQQLDLQGLHVLDGGMATELEKRGWNLQSVLWSAQVLEDAPQAVADVHLAYLEAGADCLITAGYQVSTEGFQQTGLAREQAEEAAREALRSSVHLAETARDAYQARLPRKVWIAASLGPYGAMLHNGAEYHGNYACSFADLVSFHQRRIAVLVETNADFLAFESVPSLEEAEAIVSALQPWPDAPAYVTFTCCDESHVSHGETLRACAAMLNRYRQIIAVGVNCTRPEWITRLIGELKQSTAKPILVYPNSGEQWDAVHRCWLGEHSDFTILAKQWRTAGADWIGGCCRTGPDEVRTVAEMWRG